jgi:hypothetical protein
VSETNWLAPAPRSARNCNDITDLVTERIPDPRHELRLALWRMLYPLMSSAGWRTFRDKTLDEALDAIEATYRRVRD